MSFSSADRPNRYRTDQDYCANYTTRIDLKSPWGQAIFTARLFMSRSSKYNVIDSFETAQGQVDYFSLKKLEQAGFTGLTKMPISIRILAESVVRSVNGQEVTDEHVELFSGYTPKAPGELEIPFSPARVLLQDFTGVPCVVDLAAMRSAMAR